MAELSLASMVVMICFASVPEASAARTRVFGSDSSNNGQAAPITAPTMPLQARTAMSRPPLFLLDARGRLVRDHLFRRRLGAALGRQAHQKGQRRQEYDRDAHDREGVFVAQHRGLPEHQPVSLRYRCLMC